MFTRKKPQRVATSVVQEVQALMNSEGAWFDGTAGSIDNANRHCSRLLTQLREACMEGDIQALNLSQKVRQAQKEIQALGEQFFEGANEEVYFNAPASTSRESRRFAFVHLDSFLRDNRDLRTATQEERVIRARNFAKDQPSEVRDSFVHAVLQKTSGR